MAKNDFRNSNRNHGRRHQHTPHDPHFDDVSSHDSEPARRAGKRIHDKKEKNQHKERTTKMSKRATRIISSVAASIAFIFTLTANTFGFESRNQRTDFRAGARASVFSKEFDFDKRDAGFYRQQFSIRDRSVRGFERSRGEVFASRFDTRRDFRALATFNVRARERDFDSRVDSRPDYIQRSVDVGYQNGRFDVRRDGNRREIGFRVERELRFGNDFGFSGEFEARTNRDIG